MELMDEIVAGSSGLLSASALKVTERSCSCFMVHVRCGIIVFKRSVFPLVNTLRKAKLNRNPPSILLTPLESGRFVFTRRAMT